MDTIDREAVEIRNPNKMPGSGGSTSPDGLAVPNKGQDNQAKNQPHNKQSKQVFKLDLEKIKQPANQ